MVSSSGSEGKHQAFKQQLKSLNMKKGRHTKQRICQNHPKLIFFTRVTFTSALLLLVFRHKLPINERENSVCR